jgi:2-polyprenyl-3-methyl-5-hydroxy-6-metoxy-1,4-benzoquinol methylase
MCGNGKTTEFLQQQKALVTGFDIFQEEIQGKQLSWFVVGQWKKINGHLNRTNN